MSRRTKTRLAHLGSDCVRISRYVIAVTRPSSICLAVVDARPTAVRKAPKVRAVVLEFVARERRTTPPYDSRILGFVIQDGQMVLIIIALGSLAPAAEREREREYAEGVIWADSRSEPLTCNSVF